MKYLLVLALLVLGGVGLAFAATGPLATAASSPVYTVPQVQAALARHPGAWVGRTVLVRGVVSTGLGPSVCLYVGPSGGQPPCHTASTWLELYADTPVAPRPIIFPALRLPAAFPSPSHFPPMAPPNRRWLSRRGGDGATRAPRNPLTLGAFARGAATTIKAWSGALSSSVRIWTPTLAPHLVLTRGQPSPLLAALYRLPLLGGRLRDLMRPRGAHVHRILLLDPRHCASPTAAWFGGMRCPDGQLLDAVS